MNLIHAIFGTKHQRDRKRLLPLVTRINEFELEYQSLSEAALIAKTAEFRDRLAHGATLDDLLPEAFAAVKNACRRLCGTTRVVCGHELTWEMVPFDVQLMGGIVLHQGKISEMQTGEGKTLVATFPLYLNALAGQNVHLVTVNDYLALRDAQWMGSVYEYLGLTVGCIQNTMDPSQRREQYACDITYGTNSEFGFDYLRDNGMAVDPSQLVQRGHHFAIVDEVDSILIDEARTPLIISGPAANSTNQYMDLKPRVERLVRMQQDLCNRLVADAKALIAAKDDQNAMWKLYQVYHGMPKHKQFQHLLEDTAIRRLHEQVESMMLTEMRKQESRELREELFFTIDERNREASLTDKGCGALNPDDPEMFVLPDLISAMSAVDGDHSLSVQERNKKRQEIQASFMDRSQRVQNVDQLIKAYCLYEIDVEYVVQDNRVLIVDEFTGRILPGRRWSDGLHQAVEAKEGVEIEKETQTLATITIQNYFRLYKKLAGMTGTAETEASEFHEIYKLDVVAIPTNRPVRRVDTNDLIFKTQREKFKAVLDEVTECHNQGQPVLLGTVTVDTSELLSRMLRRANIPHNVLNAKNHAREAEIVSLAGQPGQVTIATNMAGRGTDIVLGEGVQALGGLHILGTERHESRRIDNQLRGRSGRQGDPGTSRFYLALDDDLMRLFGSDRIAGLMDTLGMAEGEAIENRMVSRAIEGSQKRVEAHNFEIRKQLLDYDNVMNQQREVIYARRREIMYAEALDEIVEEYVDELLTDMYAPLVEAKGHELDEETEGIISSRLDEVFDLSRFPGFASRLPGREQTEAWIQEILAGLQAAAPDNYQEILRYFILETLDRNWKDHLLSMDHLRDGIGLRGYGQKDPKQEYKREGYDLFRAMLYTIAEKSMSLVLRLRIEKEVKEEEFQHKETASELEYRGSDTASEPKKQKPVKRAAKVGRNDPCTCGSGKKFKSCCGR